MKNKPSILWGHLCEKALKYGSEYAFEQLYLFGITTELNLGSLPFTLPKLNLIIACLVESDHEFDRLDSLGGLCCSTTGSPKISEIECFFSQGHKINKTPFDFPLYYIETRFTGIEFENPGIFEFSATIDGNIIHSLPLLVSII